jgi:hypothetical protein
MFTPFAEGAELPGIGNESQRAEGRKMGLGKLGKTCRDVGVGIREEEVDPRQGDEMVVVVECFTREQDI